MTFDIHQAIADAQDGDTIYLPKETIQTDQRIVINDKRINIVGRHRVTAPGQSVIKCPGMTVSGERAAYSRFEGFLLDGRGEDAEGFDIRARVDLEHIAVRNFQRDGFVIRSQQTGQNVNQAVLRFCEAMSVRHGLRIAGPNSNVILVEEFSAILCEGWGIYDSGFLGNTYIACHGSHNTLGHYKTDNVNARHVFLGCYGEMGSPKNEWADKTLVVGGILANGNTGGMIIAENKISHVVVDNGASANGRKMTFSAGRDPFNAFTVRVDGDNFGGISFTNWNPARGTLDFSHGGSRTMLHMTTDLTTMVDEAGTKLPRGQIVFPDGFWVPVGNGRYRKITVAALLAATS